ncbi:hypothetical protein ABT090_24505 [Streptomyces asoensis]|uniref:hypothetical protein n=1 Tax=Streptomyces asoensis TaxID=249586 RepID=UPI00331FA0C3
MRGDDTPELRPAAEDLLRLPGLRRHLANIAQDLGDGFGCLWILPDPEIGSGRADRILDELLSALNNVVEVPRALDTAASGQLPRELGHGIWATGTGAHDSPGSFDSGFDYDDGFGDWDPPVAARHVTAPAPGKDLAASSVTERLAKELGLDGDPVAGLTSDAEGRAPVLVIRAWNEDDSVPLSQLLRRLQAAVKDAGLPPSRRPRLLIAARLGDLAVDALESLDLSLYRPHWWWSVWSRLDTAILVAEAGTPFRTVPDRSTPRKHIMEAVRRETVAEVCGPDLLLAASLAELWTGEIATLRPLLATCRSSTGAPVQLEENPAAAYAPAPEPSRRPAWATGLLDSWEGQVRCTPAEWMARPEGPDRLDKLVWQAQNRILLPLIDDARARIIALLPGVVVRTVRHVVETYVDRDIREGNGSATDLGSMELGEIWTAVRHREFRFSRTQRNRIATLRTARNKLAHRCPLDDEGLRRLVEELTA